MQKGQSILHYVLSAPYIFLKKNEKFATDSLISLFLSFLDLLTWKLLFGNIYLRSEGILFFKFLCKQRWKQQISMRDRQKQFSSITTGTIHISFRQIRDVWWVHSRYIHISFWLKLKRKNNKLTQNSFCPYFRVKHPSVHWFK